MLDVDMRNPVLDFELPPNVATPDEIRLADELLHRLEQRYLGRYLGTGLACPALASVPG
jgi:hypothetical protein